MILVKKIDENAQSITLLDGNELKAIPFDHFIEFPKVGDVVQLVNQDNQLRYVVQSTSEKSTKSKMVGGLLGIFLGGLGIHNFYLGHTVKGVIQLLLWLFGWIILVGSLIPTIWGFIEGVGILCSSEGSNWHKDANGKELRD